MGVAARRTRWRVIAAFAAAVPLVFALWVWTAPGIDLDAPQSLVLEDRDGALLGAALAADEQWRFPPIASVPPRLEAAIVAFEDKRFRRHPGVDPLALGRAAWTNLREGRRASGASTITMQVVRLSRPDAPRTVRQKIAEVRMALRLERTLDKDAILAAYVSHAPYGGNVVGLEAAAWRYFGRPPAELSWAEAALLAVLPKSPAQMHLARRREALQARRDALLARLAVSGVIDDETHRLARLEPLPDAPRPLPRRAPHLLDRAASAVAAGGPRRVRTSVDGLLQDRVVEVAERHRRRLAGTLVHNAAVLVLDVHTGEVLAYVGNAADPARPEHAPHVDVIQAPRSSGSALKPFLYGALFEEGDPVPSQIVADVPIRIGGFAPENFDRRYDGAVPARTALARSLNVPAVRLLAGYGVDRYAALLRSMGMSTLHRPASDYGLSLVLGGGEATLFELTGMYAGLARTAMGEEAEFFAPTFVPAAGDRAAGHASPIGPGAAWLVLEALTEVERPGVEAAWRSFASSRRIAWKTGTSWGHRDAWALGVTPRYAVGVWVGNADGVGRPGTTGHAAAAPILFEVFGLLPDDGGWFEAPLDATTEVRVCVHSGMRAGRHCPRTRAARIPRDAPKAQACAFCETIHCDEGCRWRVHAGCEAPAGMHAERRFVLPPAMAWFHARGNPAYRPPPPWRADCRETGTAAGAAPLALVHPRPGGRIHVPVDLDGTRGRAVFTAAHRTPDARIHWHLGDRYLGTTRDPHQIELAPDAGEHALTLVDEEGASATYTFQVGDDGRGAR